VIYNKGNKEYVFGETKTNCEIE